MFKLIKFIFLVLSYLGIVVSFWEFALLSIMSLLDLVGITDLFGFDKDFAFYIKYIGLSFLGIIVSVLVYVGLLSTIKNKLL